MTAEPLLEIKSLSLTFGDRTALDQVSLTVWAGEIVGLLGRNGAGKTTLMKTVMGLLSPDAGEIHRRTVMKFLPQESMLPRDERETLSGFEVRRLEISRALSARPGLLLLDEPLSGVDPMGAGSLASWIRELARQGTGVLLSIITPRRPFGSATEPTSCTKGESWPTGRRRICRRREGAIPCGGRAAELTGSNPDRPSSSRVGVSRGIS